MSNRIPMKAVLCRAAVALALLLAPGVVLAQDGAARVRAGLDAAAAARFDAVLDRARSQSLPTDPLVNKALEGLAKQVPASRVMMAVEQRLTALVRAREALGARPASGDEIAGVADAMQRGVGAEAIQTLRAQAGDDEPIAVAAHVLADLQERGLPVDVALEVLGAWRERGGRAGDLPDLPAGIDRLLRQGMQPSQAGNALAASLRAGVSAPGRPENPGARGRPDRLPVQPPVDPTSNPGRGRGKNPPPA